MTMSAQQASGSAVDWTIAPLREVQFWAVRSASAAVELARRYAEDDCPTPVNATRRQLGQLTSRRRRIQEQWLRGWNGQDDPYFGKGANFAAPLRSAYRDGKRKRAEIESAFAKVTEEA
jgi:hypothetical protein